MSPSKAPYPDGTVFNGRYEVRGFLGRGAAGAAYKVFDAHLGVEVALKLLDPVGGGPAAWSEAQVLEKLGGDYLLPVHNADVIAGTDIRFITTKLMTGGDIATACQRLGVAIATATAWSSQIAHAAERLHSYGLLHRDIKPGNCFLGEDGYAYLADLGMAISIDPSGTSLPDGTPVTVAPEVLDPQSGYCSVKSDVFSLGATTFFMITGEYPVADTGQGKAQYLDDVRSGKGRRLRELSPHATKSMAIVIERALSKNPEDRQTSALEFANQLATATIHRRSWHRVEHAGHHWCLEAPKEKTRQGAVICTNGASPGYRIESKTSSGRAIRDGQRSGVKLRDIPKELRTITASI
ncbi:hypothetical protein GCM10009836_61560 [Pseudonocardia ailaonensis]|uniref:non-specific serine/threonine protein kinase n=1 Tax=Pseudonocardia ailaonensis TaxID=367279 RepID=A0ABN2NJQ8_9PSEU